jgi:diacylglycerol kinase family enzyme
MRMRVIVNSSAGTAISMSREQLAAAIELPLKAAGHEVMFEVVEPEGLQDAIERSVTEDFDALIIGGGDGSVRSAAVKLMGSDKALGVIPLGTMNLLARDLGIPFAIGAAVNALSTASAAQIDMARVNDHYFLCASIMGLVTQYSAERQQLRGKKWHERFPAYVSAIRSLLASRHRMAVAIEDGREVTVLRALSIAICSNDYDETSGMMLKRSQLDGQTLTLYAAKHRSGWGMIGAVAKILAGLSWNDPRLSKLRGNRFTISTRQRKVWLANDGELEEVATPLIYTVLPGALKVLKPAPSAEQTASEIFALAMTRP